ncbi:MAG: hypothetical protein IPJ58_19145 [Ardenticatenia bacterium]|nr:hypothetical protein [Ardenticatenia bacterium]
MLHRRQPKFLGVPVGINHPGIEVVDAPTPASIAAGLVDRGLWAMWPFQDGSGGGGYSVGKSFTYKQSLTSNPALVGFFKELAFRQCRLLDKQPDYFFAWLGAGATLPDPASLGYAPDHAAHQAMGLVSVTSQENIFAHELGHNFGFGHSGSAETITEVGWEPRTALSAFFETRFVRVSTLLKLMNDGALTLTGVRWINPSGGGYENVLLKQPTDAYEAYKVTGDCNRAKPGAPPAAQILIAGQFPLSGSGTPELDALQVDPNGTWDTAPVSGFENLIRLRDGSGNLLYETSFPDSEISQTWAYFVRAVPASSGMETIEILRNGSVISSRSKSANAPVISGVSPSSGSTISSLATVSWSMSDSDGGSLTANVMYSPDQGGSWETIAKDLTGSPVTFDPSSVPTSNNGTLRIEVSDGFRSTYADITNLTVGADHAPTLSIAAPQNGQTFKWGENVLFLASAHDLEDGWIAGSQITWSSSLDGALGSGDLNVDTLSPGSHVITAATMVNSLPAVSTVSITINPVW